MDFGTAFSALDRLSGGWATLKRAPLPMLFGALLLLILSGGGSSGGGSWDGVPFDQLPEIPGLGGHSGVGSSDGSGAADGDEPDIGAILTVIAAAIPLFLLATVFGLVWMLFWLALECFVRIGFTRWQKHAFTTRVPEMAPLFSGLNKTVGATLYRIITSLISVVAATILLAIVGGAAVGCYALELPTWVTLTVAGLLTVVTLFVLIYLHLGFVLGDRVIALEGANPAEALKRSWALARGNRPTLFWFLFVCGLVHVVVALVGVLTCGLGLLLLVPALGVTETALTEAYLLHVDGGPGSYAWTEEPEPDTAPAAPLPNQR